MVEVEEVNLKDLERASPIIQVAIELGIKIQGSMGRCFKEEQHSAETEAMTLYFNAAKNSFLCKTCRDVRGSVIDLVCQKRSMSREEAIAWLAHRSEFDLLTRQKYHGRGRKKM